MVPVEFFDRPLARQEYVNACLEFEGLPYNRHHTQVWREDGKWRGFMNCYGLPLMAAKGCELLPFEFDVNLPPQNYGQSVARTLWQLIHDNGEKREHAVAMCGGDIVLLRYRDVDPRLTLPHHVAVCIDDDPITILHAESTVPNGLSGSVHRAVIDPSVDPLMFGRVSEVWSMYNFRD